MGLLLPRDLVDEVRNESSPLRTWRYVPHGASLQGPLDVVLAPEGPAHVPGCLVAAAQLCSRMPEGLSGYIAEHRLCARCRAACFRLRCVLLWHDDCRARREVKCKQEWPRTPSALLLRDNWHNIGSNTGPFLKSNLRAVR